MGKKPKGALLDLDDPEAEATAVADDAETVVAPTKGGKGGGKKGKKGRNAAPMDLSDPEAEAETDAANAAAAATTSAAPPPPPRPATAGSGGGGKKAGGKKGKKGGKFDFGDDDDDDALDPLARSAAGGVGAGDDEDDDDDEPSAPVALTKPKKKQQKAGGKKAAASAFALLNGSDGEEAAPEEGDEDDDDEDAAPAAARPSSSSKKPAGAAAAFAALSLGDEEDGGDDEDDDDEPPAIAAAKPKKDKKKKSGGGSSKADVDSLFAALGEDGGDEGAAAGEAEEKKKKKKDKKASADVDSLFAALGEDGGDEGAAAGGDKKEKKKKKSSSRGGAGDGDVDSLFAALGEDVPARSAEEEAAAKEERRRKRKEKKEAEARAAAEAEAAAAAAAAAKAAAAAAAPAKGKKGKGKGKAAADDEEDLDAILAELGGGPPPAPKKEEEKAFSPSKPAAAAASPSGGAPAAGDGDDDGDGDGDGDGATGEDGKELTAAQKKKLKKKQKEKEKKAASGGGAGAGAGEGAGDDGEAAAPSASAKPSKPVKESAAVRRMREQLELRQRLEAEARAAEEAARKEEEERIAREEEEERRKAEEAERRKAEKKAKREELKRQGKLLTGKAKAEADRLAAMRAQLLAQAAERGVQLPSSGGGAAGDEDGGAAAAAAAVAAEAAAAAEAAKPKRVVYQTKKQLQKKKTQQEEEELQKQEDTQQDQQKQEAAAAAAAAGGSGPAPMEQDAAKEEEEDWEAAADSWEEVLEKPAEVLLPGAANGKKAEEEQEQEGSGEAEDDDGKEDEDDEEDEDEEESGSGSGSGSDEATSSEYSDSDDDSDDDDSSYEEDSDDARERRIDEARSRRLARFERAREQASVDRLRSPICCILGHVDVGKTKILDNVRRTNVQDGEAGGITQQIGATFVPGEAIERRTAELRGGHAFEMKVPGLLVIDTPGHESFTNLRQRGSGLCDIAVLVVDLMHGLEQQTIESIQLLKLRKTPFIIAMNKVDRLYGWESRPDAPIRDALQRQSADVQKEFEARSQSVFLQLNEQGLNVSLYWKNSDPRRFVNVVPTSAVTGEGVPDLLQLMIKLTQTMMAERLALLSIPQATVLEVKTVEGLGTTVDVVLINGTLKEGDRIVVCGLSGPIVTRIKSLKTPQVLKEMRVKGALVDHKEVSAAIGVKVVAPGMESAVAGTQMYVVGPEDDEEELKDAVMADMADIFGKIDKTGHGVCVQASTLGSLEALLAFLSSPEVGIPVSGINLGPVHKKDVLRANVMAEKGFKKYAVLLCFDVPVTKDARELAAEYGVTIFTSDIIYHLHDAFKEWIKRCKLEEQEAARLTAVFPCRLKPIASCIFNNKSPIVMGVDIIEGVAKVGTPLCVPSRGGFSLGRIASMELDHKPVDVAKAGQSVAMKIEAGNQQEASRVYGRHFDAADELVSRISRESIDALKEHFRDVMSKDDWRLVVKLKAMFQIN